MADDFLTELLSLMARDLTYARLTTTKAIANPAAGAEFVVTNPGGVMWELVAVSARYQADANVAARVPDLRVTDGDGNVLADVNPQATIAAGNTFQVTWSETVHAGYTSQGSRLTGPVPMRFLYPGWSVRSSTQNVQVGDQWSLIFLTFREWDVTSILQEVEETAEQFQAYISRRA